MNYTLTTLATFDGTNGSYPNGRLIADAEGNLFGTTQIVGDNSTASGTVFEIKKTASGYASTPTVLARFNLSATDGYLLGGLVADADGNLFGITNNGGTSKSGTVFEIKKINGIYSDTPKVLASFDGTSGRYPSSGLIIDTDGNLFGTTPSGGATGSGTVFEIENTETGYSNTPKVLVSFDSNTTGASSFGSLIADAKGNLFGTTLHGGANGNGNGTIFEIEKTEGFYSGTKILATFDRNNIAANPYGGLIVDADGNLFGTTIGGGTYANHSSNGDGTVFEIEKISDGYFGAPKILASLDANTTGDSPSTSLIVDSLGNLFGTTETGGANGNGNGTVFEIEKIAGFYSGTPKILVTFDRNTTGANPGAGLTADATGNLLGTTNSGGGNGYGTVFRLSPSSTYTAPASGSGTEGTPSGDGTLTSLPVAPAEAATTEPDGSVVAPLPNTSDSSPTTASVTSTPTNNSPAPLTPPAVTFDPSVMVSGPTSVTMTGTASAAAGIAGVEIFEGPRDLGAATVAADGRWTFGFDDGAGTHTGLTALATATDGATATATSHYDLDTGLTGAPYKVVQTRYDGDDLATGETYFRQNGAVFKEAAYGHDENGTSRVTQGGSYFDHKPFYAYTDIFAPDGTQTEEDVFYKDGHQTVQGLVQGATLHSIYNDTFFTQPGGGNTFVFTSGFGQDTLTRFILDGPEHDTLSLPDNVQGHLGAILHNAATDANGDAVLHLNRNDAITLQGVTVADIRQHREVFSFGT